MKKIIKISLLIVFIIFVLGITISNAELRVTKDATAKQMLNELNNDGYLIGISDTIRDQNPNLLCTQQHNPLNTNAKYKIASNGSVSYPGDGSNSGWARAYALAAPGYVKTDGKDDGFAPTIYDERQWAWYYFEGDTTTENDLVTIAKAYQDYKNSEEELELVSDSNAETTVNGNNMIYGPIKIKYSYASASSGSKSDEWGGFNYAFFDENGNNISDKIKLCILGDDGTYTPITSTLISAEGESKGYYKVATSDYSNVNLYLLTSDKTITNGIMKFQGNTVDYTADVYNLEGSYYVSSSGINLCSSCRYKITTDYSAAIGNSDAILNYGGGYYKYIRTSSSTVTSSSQPKNRLVLGGTTAYTSNSKFIEGSTTTRYGFGGTYYTNYWDAYSAATHSINGSSCPYCSWHGASGGSHGASHITTETTSQYIVVSYYFTPWSGCGNYVRGGKGYWQCGSAYVPGEFDSQGLLLIDTTEEEKSSELVLNAEFKFLKSIDVKKVWIDGNNTYKKRPTEIEVKLLANGVDTGKTINLNTNNNWTATFEKLNIKDDKGKEIKYTVQEKTDVSKNGYVQLGITGNEKDGYIITNMLKTEVAVNKVWNDEDDLDEFRPGSITVKLLANGADTGKTVTLTAPTWKATFSNLHKYDASGKVIEYTLEEISIDRYDEPKYVASEDSNTGNTSITITNNHTPNYAGYIEITGKVWEDGASGKANDINGKLGDTVDAALGKIKVKLKDAKGNPISATYTDENGNFTRTDYALTSNTDGSYKIRVNYDNSKNVYKLYKDANTVKETLKTAYVEFEYDAMKYTTVATASTGENTSKAIENETTRNNFDSAYTTVTSSTLHPDNWTDNSITAITKDVISFETYADKTTETRNEVLKYCNGNGTYKHTNPDGAWQDILTGKFTCEDCIGKGHSVRTYGIKVEIIQNVNLGLFKREQPKVGIFSDISKVEATMQNQKYTYLYNVRSNENNDVGLQVKFQNKDTYTYRRPVNPADIAYLNDGHEDEMTVFVTYEVKVGNLSTTLPVTIHNIINAYELEYKIVSIKMGGKNIAYTPSNYYTATQNNKANEILLNGLDIKLQPQTESEKIELTYEVSLEAIRGLLNEEATLNNCVEIQSYSTQYGANTLYAEQRTGGRTNLAYAGYDYESHPGNADIFINGDGLLEATKPELDTDMAPSFVLVKDEEPKVLSGTVWEDTDYNTEDNFRLGNGKNENEKGVEKVKVELLKVNADGTMEAAYLYSKDATKPKILAVTYTNSDGYYAFGSNNQENALYGYGVVIGDTYVIKYTYGEEANQNARNYKSTIISPDTDLYNIFKGTMSNDDWYLNLNKGYSIAVDDIEQRVKIEDLQYSNFDEKINMTAYSKPFKMQVEFDASEEKTSAVLGDGEILANGSGKLEDELNVFDFGIIERAREDIFVDTTIDYIKITLANGQSLTEGNPNEKELNYAKAVGFGQTINTGANARNAMAKQITVEMDTELIQGAQLDIKYVIKVTNNSEKDYDYYVDGQIKTEYYYFGTNEERSPEITDSVNYLVDYLDADMNCTWQNVSDWEEVSAEELYRNGFISEKTFETIEGKYKAYSTTKYSKLKTGETVTDYVTATKLLSNQDENSYDNHAEILKIDAKTARTIKESRVIKEYKMGNYVPSLDSRKINTDINQEMAGLHEQDDDRIKVTITPPTGLIDNIIRYSIIALPGLVIIAIAIIFAKKKGFRKRNY